jgi:hypothetical protein
MWMGMSQDGVEIVDHIGTAPSGREAKIVEVREIPGLAREQVIDAIKPTIILRGEIIQMGEVIVGRPPYTALSAAGSTRAAEPPPPEMDDEPPAPVHEVETITMAPPLRKWSPAEEEAPAEEVPDAPALLAAEDAAPNETPESLPEERDADLKTNAETPDEPRLDVETAAIIEAEEGQNATEETPAAAPPHEEQGGANETEPPAEPPPPKRTRRKKTSAETANSETPDEKPAGRKTRTAAARKPRKKTAAAPEDADAAPKEGA